MYWSKPPRLEDIRVLLGVAPGGNDAFYLYRTAAEVLGVVTRGHDHGPESHSGGTVLPVATDRTDRFLTADGRNGN